jgi:restriction system protein
MGSGLAFQIEQHNRSVRDKLLDQVRSMDPIEFESLVSRVLTAIGFDNVSVTNASGDSGIDVRGVLVVGDVIRTRMAVQVKRWRNNVQSPVVQQVRGSLGTHEQGLIITTSDFSSGAIKEAERPSATPIALMNREQFFNLMVEHDIGIHRSSHDIIELGEPEPEA